MLATALTSCSEGTAPRVLPPQHVDAYCGSLQARATSIDSVLTSTNDAIIEEYPTAAGVRAEIRAAGGVIAHWDEQLLALPRTSRILGATDGYARVYAAAIPVVPNVDETKSRRMYLYVDDHGKKRWIAMEAFDVQNVCVEGKPES